MIREKAYVSLSDNDESRLTIYDVPQEETDRLTGGARKAFLQIGAIEAVVLIAMIVLFVVYTNAWGRLIFVTVVIADLFMFSINVNLYRQNVQDFHMRCHYIKVELTEKLPIEKAVLKETKRRKETLDFYPVKAKDLKRTYSTTIYLKKEEYDNFEAGKVMTIYVSLKKDRKKKGK